MDTDTLVFEGGAVKVLGNGRVGGHLVRFSTANDPDLTGDFFTPATKFGKSVAPYLFYEHAMDARLGDREIGEAAIKTDDVGVWVEAQLALRDDYEKAIYKLAEEGKLGWSSGTAGHLVRRKKVGKSWEILSWPIIEASLTPHPAEARTSVVTLKSLYPDGVVAAPSFEERSSGLVAGLVGFRDMVVRFSDQRIKAGRVLSAANRGRIASVVMQVKPMLADLEALLAETEPTEANGEMYMQVPEGNNDVVAKLKALRIAHLLRQLSLRG